MGIGFKAVGWKEGELLGAATWRRIVGRLYFKLLMSWVSGSAG